MIVIVPHFFVELVDGIVASIFGLIREEQFAFFYGIVNERLVNVFATGYHTIGIVYRKFAEGDIVYFIARGKRNIVGGDVAEDYFLGKSGVERTGKLVVVERDNNL